MKKFIKKTIAGLIAGVMAISSMPFTALADTASDKAFIQSKINSGAPTYATTTSISGNALSNHTGYMNNILVSGNYDQRARAQFALDNSNGYYIAAHALDKAVAVYDGTNDVKIPVAVEAKDGYCKNNVTVYGGIDYVALKNGGQFSLGNSTWIRANTWVDYGDNSDTSHDFSTDDTVNKERGNSATGYFQVFKKNWAGTASNNNKQWKNYITFTPDSSTPDSSFNTNYYASLTTLTYKCQADIYAEWGGGGKGNKQNIAADTSDYTVDYKVINYKPLKDLLDDVDGDLKNTFNTVSANESNYDASTVSAYYSALAELYRFNLTDGLTVDTVATKANNMKTLISNYNTAKNQLKVKYTFVKADGTRSVVGAVDEAEALANKPTNTASTQKTYAGENQHKWTEYTWPEKATNYTFTEQATEKFEACNVVNGQCTDCGNVTLDTSAYDAALAEAEAKALNPDNRYTADSINALKDVIDSVKIDRENVKNQAQLNALVTRLQEANNSLVQAKFNVVFVTVGLDSTTENEKFNDYIEYGETCDADAGANVKKWVVTTDNGNTSTVIDNFDQKASFVITKDAKIYAYLSGEDSSTTSSKVTFLGRHNQVVAIRYVAEGKTLETTKVDAPSIPFYHFENWDVDYVKGDGNEYTVKATYTCNQASSDFCTVHFGKWSKAYAYDSYVYLPNTVAGTKYALYSDEQCTKLLTVLDGVDFYAPKASDIYVKAYDAEAEASIAVTGSFAEKDVEKGKKYANFNCKFYLPDGANAIEWGVEVLSPDGTRTAKVKAEKLSERNEYTVRFGTAIGSSVTSIKGRAYLVYVQNGVKNTIYSPEYVTVNLNA